MNKKDKNNKIKIPSGLASEIGAMIEDFDDKLSLVAEQTSRIPTIEKHMDLLREDVNVVKIDLEIIKYSLKRKVDLDEFKALEHRVSLLESRR